MKYAEWLEKHSKMDDMEMWPWTPIDQVKRGSILSHWGNADVVKSITPTNRGWSMTVYDGLLGEDRTHTYKKSPNINGNDMLVKIHETTDDAFVNAILDAEGINNDNQTTESG